MKVLLVLILAAGQNAFASRAYRGNADESNPDSYWGRGFGCSQAAENYQISLEVADLDADGAKAEAVASAAGAPVRHSMNDGTTQTGNGVTRRYRQVSYIMPAKSAEKVAKKLMDVGELTNYQLNKQGGELKPLNERIEILEKELSENQAALERMPAAKYFVSSRLKSLKQALSTCEQGASKASINLTLMEKAAK